LTFGALHFFFFRFFFASPSSRQMALASPIAERNASAERRVPSRPESLVRLSKRSLSMMHLLGLVPDPNQVHPAPFATWKHP
jgi:hypothetical protein